MTWVWGAVNAATITTVIWMNGRGWRAGWAVGCAAQLWLVAFGLLGPGPWTFAFSTGPAVMFAVNWWLHPRRVARRVMLDAAIVRAAVVESHQQPSRIITVPVNLTEGRADQIRAEWDRMQQQVREAFRKNSPGEE